MTSANCTLRTANGSRPVSRQRTNTGTSRTQQISVAVYQSIAVLPKLTTCCACEPPTFGEPSIVLIVVVVPRVVVLLPPPPSIGGGYRRHRVGSVGQTASHIVQCSGDKQIHIFDDDNRLCQDLSSTLTHLWQRIRHCQVHWFNIVYSLLDLCPQLLSADKEEEGNLSEYSLSTKVAAALQLSLHRNGLQSFVIITWNMPNSWHRHLSRLIWTRRATKYTYYI